MTFVRVGDFIFAVHHIVALGIADQAVWFAAEGYRFYIEDAELFAGLVDFVTHIDQYGPPSAPKHVSYSITKEEGR